MSTVKTVVRSDAAITLTAKLAAQRAASKAYFVKHPKARSVTLPDLREWFKTLSPKQRAAAVAKYS